MKTCKEVNAELTKELEKIRSVADDSRLITPKVTHIEQEMVEKSEQVRATAGKVAELSFEFAEFKEQCSRTVESKNEELHRLQATFLSLQNDNTQKECQIAQLQGEIENKDSLLSAFNEKMNAHQKEQQDTIQLLCRLSGDGDGVCQKDKDINEQLTAARVELSTLGKQLGDQETLHHKHVTALDQLKNNLKSIKREKQQLEIQLGHLRANETKMSEAHTAYASERDGFQTEINKLRISLDTQTSAMEHAQQSAAEELKSFRKKHALDSESLRSRLSQVEGALKEAERIAEHKTRELEAHKKETARKYNELVQESLNTRNNVALGEQETAARHISPRDPRLQGRPSLNFDRSQPQHDGSDAMASTDSAARQVSPVDLLAKNRKKPNRLNTTVLNTVEGPETLTTPESFQPNQVAHASIAYINKDYMLKALDGHSGDRNSYTNSPAGNMHRTTELSCSVDNFDHDIKQMTESGNSEVPSSALSDPLSSDGLLDMAPLDKGSSKAKSVGVNRFMNEDLCREHKRKAPKISSRNDSNRPPSQMENRPKSQANIASRILPSPTAHKTAAKTHKASRGGESFVTQINTRNQQGFEQHASLSNSPEDKRFPSPRHNTHPKQLKVEEALSDQSIEDFVATGYSKKRNNSDKEDSSPRKRFLNSSQQILSQPKNSSSGYQVSQSQSRGPWVVPTPRNRRQRNERDATIADQAEGQPKPRPRAQVGSSRSSTRKGASCILNRCN